MNSDWWADVRFATHFRTQIGHRVVPRNVPISAANYPYSYAGCCILENHLIDARADRHFNRGMAC
ncbi:hypothetical protein SAMN05443248_7524 [Bradyrhizobium erythrophlei]|jgi:hypothetical protein|uniref:Uncharacterized protein n=1 Tax=Bradyrhizobium erythrophlei TaxID=1437360 RepID=A0A1M5XQ62_9BRAD|nr:hypothetical protein SAMN05443248_7524 [Bradyrhizobium erythrophlei]